MLVWKITILRWKITILRWKITILVWTITILRWKITILVWKITILRWQITILVWKQHEATILKKHPKFNHTCSWNDHSKKHHTCIYIYINVDLGIPHCLQRRQPQWQSVSSFFTRHLHRKLHWVRCVSFGINGEKDTYQRGKETISTRHGYPLWISMAIYGYLRQII